MPVHLTKRIVAAAMPQERPYELRDTAVRGLILRVQPSGYKAWIIQWAWGKRRTLGQCGHLSLDQARAHAATAMAEVIQQGLPSIAKAKPTSCTLKGFLDQHYAPWVVGDIKTGERSLQIIRTAFPDLLPRQLAAIDAGAIEHWWKARLAVNSVHTGKPVTKATLSRQFAALRSALSKAVEWKLLDSNPLLRIRHKSAEGRTVIRYLSPDEESRLRAVLIARDEAAVQSRVSGNVWRALRKLPPLPLIPLGGYMDHLTPVVLLAMNTGLRRGELLSLTWADVDMGAKMLTVRAERAKSGRQRHVPLNAEALDVLLRWHGQCADIPVVFQPNDVKTAWVKLLEKAKISDCRFHDLRHHFASRLVTRGVDLNTVRELLGHSDLKMTLRYAHLAPDHLAAAVEKLADDLPRNGSSSSPIVITSTLKSMV